MALTEEDLARFQQYIRPVPTPQGFTSHEIVRRAIEFDDPPRIPYSFIEPLESDFVELGAVIGVTGRLNMYEVPKGEIAFDEWGVGWRSSGRLWGHADVCPLGDLSALGSYRFPEVVTEEFQGPDDEAGLSGPWRGHEVHEEDSPAPKLLPENPGQLPVFREDLFLDVDQRHVGHSWTSMLSTI